MNEVQSFQSLFGLQWDKLNQLSANQLSLCRVKVCSLYLPTLERIKLSISSGTFSTSKQKFDCSPNISIVKCVNDLRLLYRYSTASNSMFKIELDKVILAGKHEEQHCRQVEIPISDQSRISRPIIGQSRGLLNS